jgi:hypothetical protein
LLILPQNRASFKAIALIPKKSFQNLSKFCFILFCAGKIFTSKKMKRWITVIATSMMLAIGSLLTPIDVYANSSFLENVVNANKQSTSISKGTAGGIKYEIRGTGSTNVQSVNNSISMSSGRNTVTIKNGRIALNGKDRGTIKRGDSVLLDASGRLYVNGKKR